MTVTTGPHRISSRRRLAALGLAAGLALVSACSNVDNSEDGSLLARLQEQGSVRVGFAGEKPYAYKEGAELTGQAPAVHKAIYEELGIDELDGVQVDFGQLIPGLKAGRFDVVAAGMFILPERCAEADFSEPVYIAPNAFLVQAGNPKNITDFPSVASSDAKLGVLPGAVEGIYAQKSGVAENRIVEVSSQRDGLAALKAGRIDAFAVTSISLNRLLKDNPDSSVEITEPFVPVIDGEEQIGAGAAVFRKGETELREAFNEELKKLRESGRLLELIEPFGFGPETIPPDDLTTEQLCQG
jgi:polar amino acid transport system substrate-binding protein